MNHAHRKFSNTSPSLFHLKKSQCFISIWKIICKFPIVAFKILFLTRSQLTNPKWSQSLNKSYPCHLVVSSLPTTNSVSFLPLYLSYFVHTALCGVTCLPLQMFLLCSFNWQAFPEDLCSWRPPQLSISPWIFLEMLQSTQIPCENLVLHNQTLAENELEFQYCSSLLCLPFKKNACHILSC